jgi:hypothetical protein
MMLLLSGCVGAAMLGSGRQPEPAGGTGPAPPEASAPSPEDEAARAKRELARMRADLERRAKVIEQAQAMLERGESTAAVREYFKAQNMGVMARMFDESRRGPAAGPAGGRGLGLRDRGRGLRGERDGPGGGPAGMGEPRGGPGGGPPGGPPGGPITVDERQAIRDALRQIMPERFAAFERLQQDDRDAAEREFMQLVESPRVRSLVDLLRSNPEAFRARVEEFKAAVDGAKAARLIVELEKRGAASAEIEAQRAQLKAAAERQFDMRIAGLSSEVERLANRAASLREELDHQNARRGEFISRAVEDALERARRPGKPPRDGPGPDGPGRDGPGRDGPPPPPGRGGPGEPGGR